MGRGRTIFGLLLSAIYLAWVAYLILPKIGGLSQLELNAIGDFFAGIFGPLAFLWLVLGYFQQGQELRQNNEALQLQAQELKNSVDQQRELVDVSRKQVEVELENIRFERRQAEAARLPKLSLSAVLRTRSSSGATYKVQLRNVGYYAQDVVVRLSKEEHSTVQWQTPMLGVGETSEFIFSVGGTGALGIGHCFVVECLDYKGEPIVELFYLSTNDDYSLSIQKALIPGG